jgi:signal transduction histidine kinase
MNPVLLAYTVVFSLSAVACLVSVPRARRIEHPGTREGLVVFLVSVALWSGGYVGYLLAPTASAKVALYTVGFVSAFVAVGSWLYFCAAYTGRSPRRAPYRKSILTVFFVFVALKVTNPLHNLYFTTEWATEPFVHLGIHHELLYWILLGLSYVVIAVGFFMLLERFYYTGTDSRPLVALAGLTAIPAVATILGDWIPGLLPLMYEPPGVALFAVGTLFVYFERFEAIRLTGGTDDPALFLDYDGRIRDYNQAASAIFPALEESIGEPIDSVSSSLVDHLDQETVAVVQGDEETRFYQLSSTPFISGEVTTGRLVTITDVTERETYRRQLEAKTEQLEALNRVVRHDIRNDMSVVVGWAETLEDHVDEDGKEALDHVLQKSRHVIELTEVTREFVDSLSGDAATELKPVDLKQLLETELAAVGDSYPDARFRISGEIPETSVRANEMLSSVFKNLFENAVQHNDEGTADVTVTCTEQPETVRVRIADTGPGIPDSQKDRIFSKGQKGESSSGSGIGLYLVRTLVEQFDGDVWIEDNEPRGTVFTVELSKAA